MILKTCSYITPHLGFHQTVYIIKGKYEGLFLAAHQSDLVRWFTNRITSVCTVCVCVRVRACMCVRDRRTRRNSQWSCYWRSWCWIRPRWRRSGRPRQRWWTTEKHTKAEDSCTTPILHSSSEWGQTHLSPHFVFWHDRSDVTHLSGLSVVQSPPSQFEVSSLPTLERVGLFHQVPLLQHSLTHTHSEPTWPSC